MEAKKLTENCHLITDSYGNRMGLVWAVEDKFIKSNDPHIYDSIEEIAKAINEEVKYSELTVFEDVAKDIDGYPIKHDVIYDIDTSDNISYKTREGSNVRFYAGWWIIATDSILRLTLSPKTVTVNETSVGPFKDKFDCQAELNRLNKAR